MATSTLHRGVVAPHIRAVAEQQQEAAIEEQGPDQHGRQLRPNKSWRDARLHSIKVLEDPWYQNLARLQSHIFLATVTHFDQKGFKYVLAPVTTDTISSPMGLGSDSLPVSVQLFGRNVFLADSMQFALEHSLRLLGDAPGVFYVSSSFRGEEPDQTHLNQFFHVECEISGGFEKAVVVAERYIAELCSGILSSQALRDVVAAAAGGLDHVSALDRFMQGGGSFPRFTMDEAEQITRTGEYGPFDTLMELVKEGDTSFGYKLTREGESALIRHAGGTGFVWVTEMPHLGVPFYQAYLETGGDRGSKARCADLLCGMGETLGLGERHASADAVRQALAHHQVPESSYEWYVQLREKQPMCTAGWGMGLERFLCWLLQHDDVRDMQVLPRMKGDPMLP